MGHRVNYDLKNSSAPPPNSYVEIPTPRRIALGGGALGGG